VVGIPKKVKRQDKRIKPYALKLACLTIDGDTGVPEQGQHPFALTI